MTKLEGQEKEREKVMGGERGRWERVGERETEREKDIVMGCGGGERGKWEREEGREKEKEEEKEMDLEGVRGRKEQRHKEIKVKREGE